MSFVRVTVEDTTGNRVSFEADQFHMLIINHYDDLLRGKPGVIAQRKTSYREFHSSFERIKSESVIYSTPEMNVDIPAPKYVPAMGDAAAAYFDEIYATGAHSKFRWHEVWRRMWAAREK